MSVLNETGLHKFRPGGRLRALMGVFGLAVALAVAPAAAEEAAEEVNASRLKELAQSGDFEQLTELLRADVPTTTRGAADQLAASLERYRENEARRDEQRREAYEQAMSELSEHLEADELVEAMASAIEARQEAAEPTMVTEHETVRDLVERMESGVAEAQERGEWVKVLRDYRLLDRLFEDENRYEDQLEQARRHVRVLQVYVPDRLEEMTRALGEASEDEEALEDEPDLAVDHGDWEEQLANVRQSMFRNALFQASTRHVGQGGLRELLVGATESLLVLARTDGLEEAFEDFADEEAREQFRERLERLSVSLQDPERELSFFDDVTPFVRDVMEANRRTLSLPEQVLVYEMTEGAMGQLDEFSSVIWPDDIERFSRSLHGSFKGVGIQISRRDGQLVVVSPLPNTPAQRAGVKPGDVIAQVDGQDTATWGLDRAVNEITGPVDTEVTLGIDRDGEAELLEFTIARAEIPIESIRGWEYSDAGDWDYMIDPENRIGYVRMTQFIPQTADDLDSAVSAMQGEGELGGLILDLRYNPGGLLSAAIEVVDRFIDEGAIVYTVDADGNETSEGRAQAHRTYDEAFPLVVLINEASASGSEIVAGALQDYGRATIVGSRSFGKSSVQDPFPLDQGEAILKLTTQYYQLPEGRIIDREPGNDQWGIDPDLAVQMTNQQMSDAMEFRQEIDILPEDGEQDRERASQILERGLDPQLEAALLLLQTDAVADQIAMAQEGNEAQAGR